MHSPYTLPYILSMSPVWRLAVIKDIIESDVSDKRWEIKRALMSHTPMTKEAARHLESEIRDIEKAFAKTLRPFSRRKIDFTKPIVSTVRVEKDGDDQLGALGAGLEVTNGRNR